MATENGTSGFNKNPWVGIERVGNILFLLVAALAVFLNNGAAQPPTDNHPIVSFSFDDPNSYKTPLLSWQERNQRILSTLDKYHLKAALFVCGSRVQSAAGKALLKSWDKRDHSIANHSYSHENYNSTSIGCEYFRNDVLKNDSVISSYANYTKLFRYPFLKEGNTMEKRDSMRAFLASRKYNIGYVSIDASDWYINQVMSDSLAVHPNTDLTPFKEFYIGHILERAAFYDSLATMLTGRKIKHVLLLHHNLLNALFLSDLMRAFQRSGWETTGTNDAYRDSIYSVRPDIVPAGESILWAIAKATGKYESILRYPGEDSMYEEDKLIERLARNTGRR